MRCGKGMGEDGGNKPGEKRSWCILHGLRGWHPEGVCMVYSRFAATCSIDGGHASLEGHALCAGRFEREHHAAKRVL